jgi:hypothetical protein
MSGSEGGEWAPGEEEDVDLAAEPGTEEGDRAQERVMHEGAADADTES